MKADGNVRSLWFESYRSLKKNRGALVSLGFLVALIFVSIFAPWIAPFDPSRVFEGLYSLPPIGFDGSDARFILGTDDLGRDLFSRLVFGARVSIGVGFMVVILSLSLGSLIGVFAGYVGGWVDQMVMRLTDILMSLPSILLAIVVVAILGPSLLNAVIAVAVVALPAFIRIVRAAVMAEKQKLYVNAAKGFGASHFRMIFISILPNCLAPIIVQATLGFSDGILNVAALGFLGLGAQPPTPEWGVMLSDARAFIDTAWWLVTLPGLCILAVVLTFNILGDGLRDALDPKLRSVDE